MNLSLRTLCPAVLAALAATAGAAEAVPTVTHPLSDTVDGAMLVNQHRALAGAAVAKPTSLWNDPEFATQREHIMQQLRLLNESDLDAPPLLDILNGATSYYLAVSLPQMDQGPEMGFESPKGFSMPMLFAMDTGTAVESARAWWQSSTEDMGEPTTIAGIAGVGMGDTIFSGFIESLLVAGQPDLVRKWQEAGGGTGDLSSGPVAVSSMRFGTLVKALAKLAEYQTEIDPALDAIVGPEWRDANPEIRAATWVDAEQGWRSTIELIGLGEIPAATLTPALAAHLPEHSDILFAEAIDPAASVAVAVSAFAAEEGIESDVEAKTLLDAQMRAEIGIGLDDITQAFTGEIAASVSWANDAMPIPKGVVVLGVNDGDRAAALLSLALQSMNPAGAQVDGALMAWTIMAPMVQVTVAVGEKVVVIANRPQLATEALQARAGATAPWADNSTAHLSLGLKSIGERWLPMGLAQLSMMNETIGSDPLQVMRSAGWQLNEQLQSDTPPTTVSGALLTEDEGFGTWIRDGLESLYGKENLAATVDANIAVWIKGDGEMGEGPALVVRTATGYKVFKGWGGNQDGILADAAAARTALDGYEHKLGPTLEELAVTEVPPAATFSREWLPSAQLLTKHLPETYSIGVSKSDQAWVVEEKGLPLLGNYAHAAGMMTAAMSTFMGWQIQSAERDAKQEKIAEKHKELIDAIEAISEVVQELRRNDKIPAKASDLVALGHLRLEDTAALFGGQVPTHAGALDKVGIWNQEPEEWPQAIWAIHLEPGWAAYISPWGEVEVTNEMEVPPTPADAAAGGDPESLF
ncbi:MAG: hypothetical protein PF961_07810 [Planctomycetota bacterium]|jgi:hypothetical protein|nr:hypothetical protein [Planctomycetota bacterium]